MSLNIKINMKKNFKPQNGQVVFEYIMLILVIVGVVMVSYSAIQRNLRKPLLAIKTRLEGDGNLTTKDAGTGGKAPAQYYQNVRFGVK